MRSGVVPALPNPGVRARNVVRVFTGAAKIVIFVIVRGPGKATLQGPNAADLPAFEHLAGRLDPRNRISRRDPQAMPDIHVAVSILILRVGRVRQGRRRLRALRPIVESMAEGIGGEEAQAVVIPGVQGYLQSVVVGNKPIRCLFNVLEIWKLSVVGPRKLFSRCVGFATRRA